ncbi:MAG TPA: hypothetical protein VFP84_21545, partial [Kofleriaceae bacterium]|nr:hypothetical protein [Kofleriaceae bacterium]
MRAWWRRTQALQRELAAIAAIDRKWWLLAGGVAFAERWAAPEVWPGAAGSPVRYGSGVACAAATPAGRPADRQIWHC